MTSVLGRVVNEHLTSGGGEWGAVVVKGTVDVMVRRDFGVYLGGTY